MNHADHVALVRDGVLGGGDVWADLGLGSGAFTLALADLLGSGGQIYSIDRDARALRGKAALMRRQFPDVRLHQVQGDFTQPLTLPPLDGVVAANSLHFVRDTHAVFVRVRGLLKPGGCLVVVEYNTDHGNQWVPHPFSFQTFVTLAARAGLVGARQLAERPSRFLDGMYSAIAFRDNGE